MKDIMYKDGLFVVLDPAWNFVSIDIIYICLS